jgi:hypothetical protein
MKVIEFKLKSLMKIYIRRNKLKQTKMKNAIL